MNSTSCTCHACQGACKHKPGWFLPGEAEAAARLKGMTLPAFFTAHLGVDWFERDYGDSPATFLLSPAIKGHTPGVEFPGDPRGECTFYTDGLCGIHEAKPHECRAYLHGEAQTSVAERHLAVADAWKDHQGQVETLLGRAPQESRYEGGLFGLLGGLGGWDRE